MNSLSPSPSSFPHAQHAATTSDLSKPHEVCHAEPVVPSVHQSLSVYVAQVPYESRNPGVSVHLAPLPGREGLR